MTSVINLYGGPGIGKSTTAAHLFYLMKTQGMRVELVREYVKDWAWEQRDISKYDQLYITAKQFRKESLLYGKVDYVITDSPLLLGPFYEQYITGEARIFPAIRDVMAMAEADGVSYHNFILTRHKDYVQEGRYHKEEEARLIDGYIKDFLTANSVGFEEIGTKAAAADIMRKVRNGL